MYYKGTQAECKAYDAEVTEGQNYDGVFTKNWADPIGHPNGEDFAIAAHSRYTSNMMVIKKLEAEWFPNMM